jgi:uncharacterized protein YqhQ
MTPAMFQTPGDEPTKKWIESGAMVVASALPVVVCRLLNRVFLSSLMVWLPVFVATFLSFNVMPYVLNALAAWKVMKVVFRLCLMFVLKEASSKRHLVNCAFVVRSNSMCFDQARVAFLII